VGVYKTPEGYEILPIMEILLGEKLFNYTEKYESDGASEVFAIVSPEEKKNLQEQSLHIARCLSTR
jgi:D-alanine-D-alanine ligase-like ATP-grasp enzyme